MTHYFNLVIFSDHKFSYERDNSVIPLKSSYRWGCLPPRCWIAISWRCSRFQGLDCSSIKMVRDLSSERRETVRILSAISKNLKIISICTQGPSRLLLWCICCYFLASQSSYEFTNKGWMHLKPEVIFYGLYTDIEDYYELGYMCTFSNKFSLVLSNLRKTQLNLETTLFVLLLLFYK